jgi:uncharacterized protein (DUF488 family)
MDAYTYGFSNRPWETTVDILRVYAIERLVDIRTLPGSRYAPQYNQEHLVVALPEAGIEYVHLKSLGGLRKPNKELTVNAGWRNDSFRAYADYMQTPAFAEALQTAIALMREKRTVFVCTEAVPWRCHRSLVADALLIRGFEIGDIFDERKCEPHKLTPHARVDGLHITYPAPGLEL